MTHVDDYIDSPDGDDYARWMLLHFRLPAVLQILARKFMAGQKLFCTYAGQRYRCIGASRLGDVWLTNHLDGEHGYDLRVDVAMCSEWGPDPKPRESERKAGA